MAKILLVAGEFPSVLYPVVELARRLAAEGHQVTVAARAGAREVVEHHDLDHLALEPSRYPGFLESDARTGLVERLGNIERRRDHAVESMRPDGFTRALREMAPDLVLINGEMHEHIIASLSTGVRVAILNSFVSIWAQPGLPPPNRNVQPGVGWKGTRLGMNLLWLELRLRKIRKAWALAARRVGCDRKTLLERLAREGGLDLRRAIDEGQWLIPFTYRDLPALSLHALEFEFPHRPPAGVHYVGPMVLDSRVDRPMSAPDRAALEAVFTRRRSSPDGHKLIYAGFGSTASTDVELFRRLLAVPKERPDWELVISLSERVPRSDLGPLPERVHAFSWLPQPEVLRHADVAITHGGIGTIDECVLHRVPALVYCGYETDMAGTTARVAYHGIGLAGDRERDDPATVRARLDALFSNPRFGANVERLQAAYHAYAENRVAERVVEGLLEGSES